MRSRPNLFYLFPNLLILFYVFHNFCKKLRFWIFLFFFSIFSRSVYFFITTAPIDSMKMLRTSSRLRCGFDLYGRKKRISHIFINSFTISFLLHSKKTHEVFAEIFFVKTISNPIMHINFGKVIPIRGSSLMPLPAILPKSHQLIIFVVTATTIAFCYATLPPIILHRILVLLLGGRLTLNWKRLIHIPIQSPERIKHQAISLCL